MKRIIAFLMAFVLAAGMLPSRVLAAEFLPSALNALGEITATIPTASEETVPADSQPPETEAPEETQETTPPEETEPQEEQFWVFDENTLEEQSVSPELLDAGETYSGTCENFKWTVSSWTLTITGSGKMKDFYYGDNAPWWEYAANIKYVKFNGLITYIGTGAFMGLYNLESFTIPASVTSVGSQILSGCTNLQKITVASNNKYFSSKDGLLYNKDKTTLIQCPAGRKKAVTLPSTVTAIGNFAFQTCVYLPSVTLPKGLKSIGFGAFNAANTIQSITIPAGVTRIQGETFSYCSNLKEVRFLGNPPSVDKAAFKGDTLTIYHPGTAAWASTVIPDPEGGKLTQTSCEPSGTTASGALKENNVIIHFQAKPGEESLFSSWKKKFNSFSVTSSLGNGTAANNNYSITQPDAAQKEITISVDGFQKYIIPKEVSETFLPVSGDITNTTYCTVFNHMAYLNQDRKNGKPYISTVFAKAATNSSAYQELQHSELRLMENTPYNVIITASGLNGQGATYYIEQDAAHRIFNRTGVFYGEKLYSILTSGKAVYAYCVTDSGVALEKVKLQIVKERDLLDNALDTFLSGPNFNLLGKDGFKLSVPENAAFLGGSSLSMDIFQGPIGISQDGDKLRISFGVDIYKGSRDTGTDGKWDKTKEKKLFENFKDSFKDTMASAKSAEKARTGMQSLMKKFSKEAIKQKAMDWDVAFLGYAEATIVDGRPIFTESMICLKGSFHYGHTVYGYAGTIPGYLEIKGGCAADITFRNIRFIADPDAPIDVGNVIFNIEPEIEAKLAAGGKGVLSAGIWGKGSFPINYEFQKKHFLWKLKGSFGFEVEAFFVKGKIVLFQGETTLLDKYLGSGKSYALQGPGSAFSTGTMVYTMIPRAETPSVWTGGQGPMTPQAVAASGVSFQTLQTDAYSQSQPQLARLGDGLILVWVEDDPSRDDVNRMRLVYSLYDGTSWSEPAPVADDGRNDGYPSLVTDGTRAYVAWQKIEKKLTQEDSTSLDAILENSEIYLAEWDAASKTFGTARRLTENSRYEYAATVTVENGAPVVYYAGGEAQELSQAGKQTLYRNAAGTETPAVSNCNYILDITASGSDVCCVMDGDGDTATTNDVNVYSLDGSAFDKNGRDTAYSHAVYADFNGHKTLFVSDGRNIFYLENGTPQTVLSTDRSITGGLQAAQAAAGTAILWTEAAESGNEIYAVSYENGAWTEPVRISSQGQLLYDLTVAELNGRLVGVCNSAAMTYNASSESYEKGSPDLVFFRVNDFTDAELLDWITFDDAAATPGQAQEFDVVLTNKGTTTLQEMTFAITDTLGTSQNVSRTVNLMPGATQTVTLSYTVPQNYAGTTLTVTAAASQDVDPGNNTASAVIGQPALTVVHTDTHTFDDGFFLMADVENHSAVGISEAALDVILNEESNAPAFTQTLGTLDRSQYANVEIALQRDDLIFDDFGVAKVYLKARSGTAENTVCVLLTQTVEGDCTHSETDLIPGYGASCTEPGLTDEIQCSACGAVLKVQETTPALGHSYANGSCTLCGEAEPNDSEPGDAKVSRIAGKDRHETAFKIADLLKQTMGIDAFEIMIIASGENSADALAGSYLAARKAAPILLSRGSSHQRNLEYIQKNLAEGGLVYILGGTSAVPQEMEDLLVQNGIACKRLKGKTRFDTNLAILDEVGVDSPEILVSTGYNFADSLSASATGLPILLLHTSANVLTDSQKAWLAEQKDVHFTIIGGTGAVSQELEDALLAYGTTSRLKGSGREATSVEVAKTYFGTPETVLLAYSRNFPDGLCGGPLAYNLSAPLLLVNTKQEAAAEDYVNQNGIRTGYILGGTSVVSDETARIVFGLDSSCEIPKQ